MGERKSISRKINRAAIAAYGDGCEIGYDRADEWMATRTDRTTLQYVVLDIAERRAAVTDEVEISRIHGEIVGFCAAIEDPEMVARCRETKKATAAA